MKRKIALILAVLLLSGCNTTNNNEEDNSLISADSKDTLSVVIDIEALKNSENKAFSVNGNEIVLNSEEWDEVCSVLSNLQNDRVVLPKESGVRNDRIIVSFNDEEHYVVNVKGRNSSYISLDGRAEYYCNDEILDLFGKYNDEKAGNNDTSMSPEKRLIGLTCECDEPKTPEEYLKVARKVVKPWLNSLKNEEGAYRLPSYSFTDDLSENREFHGDGYINGGREFVCYVGFDTPTKDEDTVFFASGTYDTFYHYYFGPGILARYRWENGVCTLIDYDEAFAMLTSDRLKSGLYGINDEETKYKTFYDFMNDKENVDNWLSKGYKSRLCSFRVSHNVMMLSNGTIILVDIGDSGRLQENGDLITGEMNKYFYDTEGDEKYSSPVDFIDGSGAVSMTYREGFPIVFDDYNHDGNPDFTLRISSDEKGSTYDVRCMDINGTPWEDNTEVYVYGEFDESIRLQVYDGGSILKPVKGEKGGTEYVRSGLFKDKSNAAHAAVSEEDFTDYRMYSQRYYLPEHLRNYGKEDKEIICYFWNNTEKPVTVSDEYEIERLNGEVWESIGNYKGQGAAVNGGDNAEISYDISGIDSDYSALYRIKTTASGKTIYGGFYYGEMDRASLEISTEQFPSNTEEISFTVKNCGMSAVYPKYTLYRNGEKLLEMTDNESINSGSGKQLVITSEDIGDSFRAGEYTLEATADGDSFTCKTEVIEVSPERRFYFPEKVAAEKTDDGILISLTNNIWNEEIAEIKEIGEAQVYRNGLWYSTLYVGENVGGYRDYFDVPFGHTSKFLLFDNSSYISIARQYYDNITNGDYADIINEEDYKKISSMSFEEFLLANLNVVEVNKGDLCRVPFYLGENGKNTEYVYFEMP